MMFVLVLFFGAFLGISSENWGIAVIVAAVASLLMAVVGRDTKFQTVGSIILQFGIFFVVSEIIVILAYLIIEMDLFGQIARM